jgi:dienelactone hydrolase
VRGTLAGNYRNDPELFASRIQAAVDYVKSLPEVDSSRVAIAGYCFGGTGVLQYALTGANDPSVLAVVSFHGGLSAVFGLPPVDQVTPKILVLSGGEDDASSDIIDLENTFNNASATWEITRYSGIEHAFTVFSDDRYNEWADQRSWESMYHFLQETFGEIEFESQEPAADMTTPVPYTDVDGTELLGHLAIPSNGWVRPLPAVILLPDWDGVNSYERKRATVFAEMGYVTFAADVSSKQDDKVLFHALEDTSSLFYILAIQIIDLWG